MKTYILPKLPYEYDALEPYIDARTMEIHHTKHHNAYVNNLNAALEKHPEFFEMPLDRLLAEVNTLPQDIQAAVRNNGGGHFNHTMFWEIMGKERGEKPEGKLANAINGRFATFENFMQEFEKAAAARFGSGWAWLSVDEEGQLKIHSTANQDSPVMEGLTPILGLDVWEHAYYLNYQNRRPDYIRAFWNVVNWRQVEKNYRKAMENIERASMMKMKKVS